MTPIEESERPRQRRLLALIDCEHKSNTNAGRAAPGPATVAVLK